MHRLCCLSAIVLLVSVSCSESKDDSGASTDVLYAEIRKQADPVAELTAGIVVRKLPSQGSEETNAEIRAKHGPTVQPFKDSLCAQLKKAAKPADDDEIDQVRATANQALRDSRDPQRDLAGVTHRGQRSWTVGTAIIVV